MDTVIPTLVPIDGASHQWGEITRVYDFATGEQIGTFWQRAGAEQYASNIVKGMG